MSEYDVIDCRDHAWQHYWLAENMELTYPVTALAHAQSAVDWAAFAADASW